MRHPNARLLFAPSLARRWAKNVGLLLGLGLVLGAPLSAQAQDKKAPDKKEKKDDGKMSKDDYAIDTSGTSTEIKVASDGRLSIHIKPREGLKVHPQAPLEVRLKPSAGVKTEKKKLGRADVKEAEAGDPELGCGVTGEQSGEQKIEADVSFFLCSDKVCQRMKDKVVVAVAVKD